MADHDEHPPIRPDDVDWNQRYGAEDQVWSGKVNGSLVDEVGEVVAGWALDVGCGEGADALWLAERGWTVTAVDIADRAVDRARAEAVRRSLEVDWQVRNIVTQGLDVGVFDLVSLHYPAFDVHHRDNIASALTGSVAPGGLLLVVGHATPEDSAAVPWKREDWLQAEDLAAYVPTISAAWTLERHETRARPGEHHHGSPHMKDVIVRLRRSDSPNA